MRKMLPLVITLTFLTGCGKEDAASNKKPAGPEAVTVSLASSKIDALERTVDVVGTLFGDEETTISAKVGGRVTDVVRDVGDRVSDGEPLAQIDQTDYKLYVTQAKMAVAQPLAKLGLPDVPGDDFDPTKVSTVQQKKLEAANAQARFGRAEKLFQNKPPLISEQDYADQKTAFEVASRAYDVAILEARALAAEARSKLSDLRLAEQRLADATLRAPSLAATTRPAPPDRFAVSARLVSVGEYVREGTAVFKLVADNPLKYRASVPEKFSRTVQVGQQIDLYVDDQSEPFIGTVSRVNPQVDPATRTFQIEARVPNDKGLLRPGGFARGFVHTSRDPSVTFVPSKAVVSFAGVNKVFTVKDGKAIESRVSIGARRGDWIEITAGFKGAQLVVTDGAAKLATGVAVKVRGQQTVESTTRPAVAESK